MTLRAWDSVPYLPILGLRPAEMRALEELPNRTKDQLLPIVHLRPWVAAHQLKNATDRIAGAYSSRPIVIAMSEPEPPNGRPVHAELDALRDVSGGFRQWCEFLGSNDNYIPAIQFSEHVREEEAQISQLLQLDRGLVVILERAAFPAITQIGQRVGSRSQRGQGVCFVIDFGIASRDHLQVAAQAEHLINNIRRHAPEAVFSLSASSFPDSFVGVNIQPIYERRLFDNLSHIDGLIYSDRGSARIERLTGGGGAPAPRIDYPLVDQWRFFRSDDCVGFEGYQQQALALMEDEIWNPNLRVWGTQMIERTAAGDTSAIGGAQKATAARINLHLQQQTFYGSPDAAEDTDEDWSG